jgi:hypothetical protein
MGTLILTQKCAFWSGSSRNLGALKLNDIPEPHHESLENDPCPGLKNFLRKGKISCGSETKCTVSFVAE